ncbi:aminoacyl-histidine dipeptidase [Salinivirga cyanobacteriivorans]|uniref:Cytosol non-specific dipeptidase n=1 Tax=Salinivirga cyanobacteriivorans TaxID=1307839 RepID=A0A0S2I345_9BACT|nr:aminoacyl-histidine dipeptidase [Salinivirga cyanobacteriivorans]ALO16835.1 Cytosol non-specific dipeptidase [Salinivirga cyanobacteriivorans]
MSEEIKNLEPKALWEHFYSLTQIPRPSKKEGKAVEFVKKFGEDLGLETIQDEVGNVIIRKPATKGMEDRKGVVMQGHLDMVPQANSDSSHNFETDPIEAFVDGDWVTAKGTTLGADNGMGVAAAMAVLSSNDLEHGPVEALFTVDEEAGMTGANALKPGILKGDILLNMDSEDEGELYVGCAGGEDANVTFSYKEDKLPIDYKAFKISVKGLKGGHSGLDIPLQRGNANKILFRLINKAQNEFGLRLADVQGGSLRNAIPREAFATIAVPENGEGKFKEFVAELEKTIKNELSDTDPGVTITLDAAEAPMFVIDETTQRNLTDAVMAVPNGVIRMSDAMPGLVETSTNLAVVKTSENNTIIAQCLMRSSVDSSKEELAERISATFRLAGAKVELAGAYPGWKPNMDSEILKVMQDTYNNTYGKIPEIKAIHAGLECGILGSAYPNWDMISFGPTIRYPHSPDEKVNIETVQKFWTWILETLKAIPKK